MRPDWLAVVRSLGNGELITCSNVKLGFCAEAESAKNRTTAANSLGIFIATRLYFMGPDFGFPRDLLWLQVLPGLASSDMSLKTIPTLHRLPVSRYKMS